MKFGQIVRMLPLSVVFCLCARSAAYAQAGSLTGPGATIPWYSQNNYLAGNNYPWQNYGTDFGTGGWGKYTNFSQISSDFTTMHSQGVTTVRWFVFADGRYSPDFNSDGTVSGLDSQFFSDVDTALQIANNNNVYLIPCLVDFHIWQAAQTSGSVTGGGHSALVTNTTVQQTYLDNALKPFLQHVAASPYKTNVIGYDIVNEPEWTINEIWNGGLPLAQVQTFAKNCASYIHTYGGGAYATLGSGTPVWAHYWMGLGLDFYQIHYYPNYDSYNGNGTAGSGLPTYASLNLDRPCIVGEFATADNSYTIGATGVQSAQWYLDTIYKYGYAGALGWSYNTVDNQSNWSAFAPVFTNWVKTHAITSSSVTLANGSFETPRLGTAGYQYKPAGGAWLFSGNSGIQSNGSAWGAPTAPDGTQTAFLQSNGSISQSVTFSAAGNYALSFQAARRNGQVQPLRFSVDGVQVGNPLTPAGNSFGSLTTATFSISATGAHTLTLATTNNSGDLTTFVDQLVLSQK